MPPRSPHLLASWALLALLLLCALGAGCRGGKAEQKNGQNEESDADTSVEAVPVETTPATAQTVSDSVLATAHLSSQKQVVISASAAGHLVELSVDEGHRVEADAPIGKLTNPDLAIALQSARAQVRRADAEVGRLEPLVKKGYIPRAELDAATAQREIARGELRRAQASAGETVIRSPFAGVVAARHVEVGGLVSPAQPLLTIVDPDALQLEVQVPEVVLGRLAEGQRAEVESEALPDHVFPAQVTAIAPTVDPTSGTIKVTLDITDPNDGEGHKLRPGMFVQTRIVTRTREHVVTVPKKGVFYEEGRAYVMVAKDGKARRIALETGVEAGDRLEAMGDVQAGQEVIVLGHAGLKDGAQVQIVRRNGRSVADDDAAGGDS